ncbi:MAG: alcohol dehydrogenase, partial [Arthrobacter sp.]|nr:alcohol dehydrogenase [Arthrobacter sp.]
MRSRSASTLAALGVLLMSGAASAAELTSYNPVTDARLTSPEPRNWLMTKGRYEGWSYSELGQVNTNNVKNLVPVWAFSTGMDSGHEAPPIVNDGVMFVSTPHNQVLALDA